MSISKNMSGSPWHKERVHRADGDDRRYKGRCRYFSYSSEFCSKQMMRCTGSAHCDYYEAISEEEFTQRQKMQQKKHSKVITEDECYWY